MTDGERFDQLKQTISAHFDSDSHANFKSYADEYLYNVFIKTAKVGKTAFAFDPEDIHVSENETLILHYTRRYLKEVFDEHFKVNFIYDYDVMNRFKRFIEIDWTDLVTK